MKKIVISLIIVFVLMMVGTSFAFADNQVQQEVYQSTATTVSGDTYQTPNPTEEAGVTPDSWLYTLEKWVESLQVLMTFKPEAKAELLAGLAKERLAESLVLQDKEMYQLAGETLKTYVETVTAANLSAQSAVSAGKDISEVIIQISSVETRALEVVATLAGKLPLKTQKTLVKAITRQEEQLVKIEQKLAQKQAKVEEIKKALEAARASGDLEKVAELEKKLAEAQLALAEAKETAVMKLGQSQIKMVRTQLKVLNKLGKKSVAEAAYEDEDEEKEVAGDIYRDPAKLAHKEAFRQAKEIKKESFQAAKEAKKEAFQKAKDIRKEVRQQVYDEIKPDIQGAIKIKKEAIKEAKELKKEAIKENREVKKEAIEKAKEARN